MSTSIIFRLKSVLLKWLLHCLVLFFCFTARQFPLTIILENKCLFHFTSSGEKGRWSASALCRTLKIEICLHILFYDWPVISIGVKTSLLTMYDSDGPFPICPSCFNCIHFWHRSIVLINRGLFAGENNCRIKSTVNSIWNWLYVSRKPQQKW